MASDPVIASEWFEIEAGESLRVYLDETTPTPTLSLEVRGPHGGLEVLLSIPAAERLCLEIRAMINPDLVSEKTDGLGEVEGEYERD